MRFLGSFGIILMLSSILAESFEEGEFNNTEVTGSSVSSKSRVGFNGRNQAGSTASINNLNTPVMNKDQINLAKNWNNLKSANQYAREYGLNLTWRISSYTSDDIKLSEIGPNTKLEMFNQLMGVISNLTPDSKDSIHTDMPMAYREYVASSTRNNNTSNSVSSSTSSNSKTVSSSTSSNSKIKNKQQPRIAKTTAIEETIEEEE